MWIFIFISINNKIYFPFSEITYKKSKMICAKIKRIRNDLFYLKNKKLSFSPFSLSLSEKKNNQTNYDKE